MSYPECRKNRLRETQRLRCGDGERRIASHRREHLDDPRLQQGTAGRRDIFVKVSVIPHASGSVAPVAIALRD
jgi:hypothetical protein